MGMGCFWEVNVLCGGSPELFHSRRIHGRHHTQPDLRGSLHRPNRPRGRTELCTTPEIISVEQILKAFWENHDPTTLNRQGNDVGTQYRSAIYFTNAHQAEAAYETRDRSNGSWTKTGGKFPRRSPQLTRPASSPGRALPPGVPASHSERLQPRAKRYDLPDRHSQRRLTTFHRADLEPAQGTWA